MGFMSNHVKKEFYLSTAVHKLDESIKSGGYKPKSKFGSECTSFVVEQELRECEAPGAIKNDRINKLMDKIEKELNSNNSDSEFFRNCREVTAKSIVGDDGRRWVLKEKIWNYQLGFLASLVKDVIKEENSPPKEDLSHLGWIGREMQRGNFFVKLTDTIDKPDYTVHKVVDKTGNRGIFFNYKMKNHKGGEHADDDTVNYTDGIDKGDCFLMTATPSRHQINKYDGGKETYFNRVTIVENKGNKIKQRLRENVARENMPKYIDESAKVG